MPERLDLLGKKFHSITVLELDRVVTEGSYWKCRCDCGRDVVLHGSRVQSGKTKTCGAPVHRIRDLTGQRFGRLTANRFVRFDGSRAVWLLDCDCGGIVERTQNLLVSHKTQSCGCWMKEGRRPTEETGQKYVYKHYKKAAERKKREWALTEEMVYSVIKLPCTYCGMPPSNSVKLSRISDRAFNYTGIDRIDASKGYLLNNIVPSCYVCNRAKSDMTKEAWETYLKHLANFQVKKAVE